MAFADRITSVVLFALGAAMLYGGLVMDRLEIRQIHPASIPGLVPIMLGVILMVCAVALYLSTRGKDEGEPEPVNWTNLTVAGIWSTVFALGFVGRLPFVAAVAIYVFGFVLFFGWPRDASTGRKLAVTALSAGFAIAFAFGVSTLFRYGFLVRLP